MGVRRRNTELGLLVMAVVVIGAAYTLATLAADKQFPADIGPFLLMVLGLLLVAHLAVRRLAPTADPILLPLAALLNGLGYVVITTTPDPQSPHLPEHLAGLQAAWTAVGHRSPSCSRWWWCAARASSPATATRSPSRHRAAASCRCSPTSAAPSTARGSG